MKITFVFYNKDEKTFLWDWNDVKFIPRKGDFIELTSLGYGDKGIGKFTTVNNVLWKEENNVEITLSL